MGRSQQTVTRKQAILDGALECFASLGYDDTTIEDIRDKSGASTGSIYHHFGSKDRIAAALYLRGVQETQDAGLEALLAADSAEAAIADQVAAYIDWVVDNPAFARFLFASRHAAFLQESDSTIGAMNDEIHQRAADRIRGWVAAGEFPDIEPALRWALVFGPCRHWAGSWLRGTTSTGPDDAKRVIAAAAVAGLQALR